MKRMFAILLSAALLLGLLGACDRQGAATPTRPADASVQPTASAQAEAELSAQALVEATFPYSGCGASEAEHLDAGADREYLAAYIENAYGLSGDQWEDAAVVRATGASAFELAVLRVADSEAAVRAASALMSYIFNRQGDFAGYAPAEADMVANGGVTQDGPYAALFICPDPDGAEAAFEAALNGTLPPPDSSPEPVSPESVSPEPVSPESVSPEPSGPESSSPEPGDSDRIAFTAPNKDDMSLYGTTAIRAAWESGDPSGLSDYDREIYGAAQQVLGEILSAGMGDYDKEVAIYSWVVNNVNYDWRHQDIMAVTPRESFTPYGGLVNRTAVCLGYATSFQLLCDLAGVECITVVGAAFSSQEDHAWNMVRLGGEWYCVDVTWDANYRELIGDDWPEEYWNHFNVTSDMMAAENHQWDYANTPEATAEDHGRG